MTYAEAPPGLRYFTLRVEMFLVLRSRERSYPPRAGGGLGESPALETGAKEASGLGFSLSTGPIKPQGHTEVDT